MKSYAVATLEIALETLRTNEPINRAEGKVEQADLEAESAKELEAALQLLGWAAMWMVAVPQDEEAAA